MSQNKGFNFEKNLRHQTEAVVSVLDVFNKSTTSFPIKTIKDVVNPTVCISHRQYIDNIMGIQSRNQIDNVSKDFRSNTDVLDISMETGTGKTYVYTKTMFELNKSLGIYKFIVIVPTVSIRAGTMSFLNSEASRDHFRQDYQKDIKPFVLESQPKKKNKRNYMPQAVLDFARAQNDGHSIYVLIVNQGMINSSTMREEFDQLLFDKFTTPFEAVGSVNPFVIIDEPHRFSQQNVTWKRIKEFNPQYIIRYGATFNGQYENLLYELTAVDAFNNDLVKGVITYIEEFDEGANTSIKLIETNTKEATFELNMNGKKSRFKLGKDDSLVRIHPEMVSLAIVKLNKSQVVLSNGLELAKNSIINPFSFAESLQDKMIKKAIEEHFKIEKELLSREVKIKPITLFFIDDIEGYRDGDKISGSLKNKVESYVLAYAEKQLKQEPKTSFYRSYLEKTIQDVSLTHGGYFSKDNTDSDDKIAKEVEEILHDKSSLLSLENPRRFIFSKWTLREGWDNPNVFQICKLRSSGSETSKLQEVGRGLRLPVNEYMSRVKDETFYLNYYVDFTEKDFANQLVNEINSKSRSVSMTTIDKIDDKIIAKIIELYPARFENDEAVYDFLDTEKIVKRNNEFKPGGLEKLRAELPKLFMQGLKENKVRSSNDKPLKTTIRKGKYAELKSLWESINQQAILEYKIESEAQFKQFFKDYLIDNFFKLNLQGSNTTKSKLKIENNQAILEDERIAYQTRTSISTMTYTEFINELSDKAIINRHTLHSVFKELLDMGFDINDYMSLETVRRLTSGFNKYLLDNAFSKYEIQYNKVSSEIHPTVLTKKDGSVLSEINSGNIGTQEVEGKANEKYLFEEIFFDSDIERKNILSSIEEVVVYTKIPRNSIRIPVAGGGTYSPDFAYVVKRKDGKKELNLVIESKGKESTRELNRDESKKIKHAEEFFKQMNKEGSLDVKFETQFNDVEIADIINKYVVE